MRVILNVILFVLMSLSSVSSIADNATIVVDYAVGGNYYQSCRFCSASYGKDSVSTTALELTCYCDSNNHLTSAGAALCSSKSNGFIDYTNDHGNLGCHEHGRMPIPVSSVYSIMPVIAGSYSNSCRNCKLTASTAMSSFYKPSLLECQCDGANKINPLDINTCTINSNGFISLSNDHGVLRCDNGAPK